jgi:hypothetical protein
MTDKVELTEAQTTALRDGCERFGFHTDCDSRRIMCHKLIDRGLMAWGPRPDVCLTTTEGRAAIEPAYTPEEQRQLTTEKMVAHRFLEAKKTGGFTYLGSGESCSLFVSCAGAGVWTLLWVDTHESEYPIESGDWYEMTTLAVGILTGLANAH